MSSAIEVCCYDLIGVERYDECSRLVRHALGVQTLRGAAHRRHLPI
jgi:hypothetical protein